MSCEQCKDIEEHPNVPHVVKKCEGCGRELRILRLDKSGKGLKVKPGERLSIPKGWLTFSANPLKGRSSLTLTGLEWFSSLIFVGDLPSKETNYVQEADKLEQRMDKIVNQSTLIAPLDVNNENDAEKIYNILTKNKYTREYWALMTGFFLATAREARNNNDSEQASWATACAERCHAMVVYKENLEEVVWMGHSARRIVEVLKTWDANNTESSEEFWQETFNEHSYILSQVFAVPVMFIQERAYVGGMKIDRHEAKFVDYLFSAETSQEAIIIEIKTPASKLLGRKYRTNTYAPSVELSGAVVQLLNYRKELISNLKEITGEGIDLETFRPKCVLIIGNGSEELEDGSKRKSFELYRSSLDVEIITYDELFRKVEILAELFALKRVDPAESQNEE